MAGAETGGQPPDVEVGDQRRGAEVGGHVVAPGGGVEHGDVVVGQAEPGPGRRATLDGRLPHQRVVARVAVVQDRALVGVLLAVVPIHLRGRGERHRPVPHRVVELELLPQRGVVLGPPQAQPHRLRRVAVERLHQPLARPGAEEPVHLDVAHHQAGGGEGGVPRPAAHQHRLRALGHADAVVGHRPQHAQVRAPAVELLEDRPRAVGGPGAGVRREQREVVVDRPGRGDVLLEQPVLGPRSELVVGQRRRELEQQLAPQPAQHPGPEGVGARVERGGRRQRVRDRQVAAGPALGPLEVPGAGGYGGRAEPPRVVLERDDRLEAAVRDGDVGIDPVGALHQGQGERAAGGAAEHRGVRSPSPPPPAARDPAYGGGWGPRRPARRRRARCRTWPGAARTRAAARPSPAAPAPSPGWSPWLPRAVTVTSRRQRPARGTARGSTVTSSSPASWFWCACRAQRVTAGSLPGRTSSAIRSPESSTRAAASSGGSSAKSTHGRAAKTVRRSRSSCPRTRCRDAEAVGRISSTDSGTSMPSSASSTANTRPSATRVDACPPLNHRSTVIRLIAVARPVASSHSRARVSNGTASPRSAPSASSTAPATAANRVTSAPSACSRSSRKAGVSAATTSASHGERRLPSSAPTRDASSAETGGTVPNGVAQTGSPPESRRPMTGPAGSAAQGKRPWAGSKRGTASRRQSRSARRCPCPATTSTPSTRRPPSTARASGRRVSVASRWRTPGVPAAAVPALRASFAVAATGSTVARTTGSPPGRAGSTSPQGASTSSARGWVWAARDARHAARWRCCRGPTATTVVTGVRRRRTARRTRSRSVRGGPSRSGSSWPRPRPSHGRRRRGC